MKRSTLVKFILVVAAVIALYVLLRVAEENHLLGWGLHKAVSPNYATYSFSSYDEGRFYTVSRIITADGDISDGDITSGVKFCSWRSDWVCLEGPTFKFAALTSLHRLVQFEVPV